jgi:transcriptional regulator with XRE-family HTH domain
MGDKASPFAKRLRLAMGGMTQKELSQGLDYSQGRVSNWLHGAFPQPRGARALAKFLGVRVEWLVAGEGEMREPGVESPYSSSVSISRAKTARYETGMTLQQTAQKSGLGMSTINHFENGKTKLSVPALERLASALNVSASYLLPVTDGSLYPQEESYSPLLALKTDLEVRAAGARSAAESAAPGNKLLYSGLAAGIALALVDVCAAIEKQK